MYVLAVISNHLVFITVVFQKLYR